MNNRAPGEREEDAINFSLSHTHIHIHTYTHFIPILLTLCRLCLSLSLSFVLSLILSLSPHHHLSLSLSLCLCLSLSLSPPLTHHLDSLLHQTSSSRWHIQVCMTVHYNLLYVHQPSVQSSRDSQHTHYSIHSM